MVTSFAFLNSNPNPKRFDWGPDAHPERRSSSYGKLHRVRPEHMPDRMKNSLNSYYPSLYSGFKVLMFRASI